MIQENNPAGQAIKAETLLAARTLNDKDHGRLFFVGAVDLTLTLGTPAKGGFYCTCVVATLSAVTGFTVAGAINAGSTSAVNTAATDALGDRIDLFFDGTAWFASIHGTWSVT